MLTSLSHLALEVKYLDRARSFYVDRLGLSPVRKSETEVAFAVGETTLALRRPRAVPRGGLHVHYAFTTPAAAYDRWRETLADLDPEEVTFGNYRSLYVDDPDDHCIEIGGIDSDEAETGDRDEEQGSSTGALTSIFEIVLEVADLDRAEGFYGALGFEPVDRGSERRRVRLRRSFGDDRPGARPLDLELWEPQLGLADARGGAHVDLGFTTADPTDAIDAVREEVGSVESVDGGVRVRDPDCHFVTFAPDADPRA